MRKANLVISYHTMRKTIGWIGILLPFALVIGDYTVKKLNILNNSWFVKTNECYQVYPQDSPLKASISHYYYSSVGDIFTSSLFALSLFLFCYKGHPLRKSEFGLSDRAMSKLAAFFAIGIVVFPTSSPHCIHDNLRTFISSQNTGFIHFVFAGLFFTTLAFISIFNFRRTKKITEFGTKPSHDLYKYCGFIMLACVLIIFVYKVFLRYKYEWLDNTYPVFIFETIALIAFGVSWLTKGRIYRGYLAKKIIEIVEDSPPTTTEKQD
ncbi:hypothetical protein [Flavobacterium terrigena]|uniref:Frag1/DRAM/Sfk1 family protein n=1 Tax=Flavobacterium terrigena TaxID=402734 RepID=A0A1H6QPJ0_9FLAO|nr:hypothetical protein [Flavobacterium terrigena]SEI42894.1 hypothetical protein SAMN05660918_0514 [Flavobacterium terrigena]